MLALTLALTLGYSFPEGAKATYDLAVEFDGYLPILGRTQNRAEVKMAIEVRGEGRDSSGNWNVAYEVKEMRASANGVALPFTVSNIAAYFPPAKITVSPLGRVLKSNAPSLALPIRLPGLDSRRLPEISFLPLEFREQAEDNPIRAAQPWTFVRKFADGDITFTAEALDLASSEASFRVGLGMVHYSFEDASGGVVSTEKGAAFRLYSRLEGKGKVSFDVGQGHATKWEAEYSVYTTARNLKTDEGTSRTLTTKVKVERRA